MHHEFHIKQGDTAPSVEATLKDAENNTIDLSQADEVRFQVQDRRENILAEGQAEIVNDEGEVKYTWEEGQTDEPGRHYGEFDVYFEDGSDITVPNDGWILVFVHEQIP